LLVDPLDEQAIADALERVLDDPSLADQLARAGEARAAMFTWERTAELTMAAYTEAAA
jgi:glycosyltransferase involved in cell wall biosynthesis